MEDIKNFEQKVYEGKRFDIFHVWKYNNEFFDYQPTLEKAKQILKEHE